MSDQEFVESFEDVCREMGMVQHGSGEVPAGLRASLDVLNSQRQGKEGEDATPRRDTGESACPA